MGSQEPRCKHGRGHQNLPRLPVSPLVAQCSLVLTRLTEHHRATRFGEVRNT